MAGLQFIALIATLWWMRVSNQRELRAYVFVEAVNLRDGGQIRDDINKNNPRPDIKLEKVEENKPVLVVLTKNYGQTPAYETRHWCYVRAIDVNLENAIPNPTIPDLSNRPPLAPGVVNTKAIWLDKALTMDEIDEIRANKKAIYIWGRIEYKDAFKKNRFTTYRLKYSGIYPPIAATSLIYCQEGNDAN